jgi:hypothetical protein
MGPVTAVTEKLLLLFMTLETCAKNYFPYNEKCQGGKRAKAKQE